MAEAIFVPSKSSGVNASFSNQIRMTGLALSVAICAPNVLLPATAADFSHARKMYVPPTMIDRRVDFTALREHQAVQQYRTDSIGTAPRTVARAKNTSNRPIGLSATSKNGISAPPPPLAGSISSSSKAIQDQMKKLASSPSAQAALANMKAKANELVRSGRFEEAKQLASRALQMAPQDKTVLRNMSLASLDRAKSFVNSQDFDKALQYARESLAFDGTSPEAKKIVDGIILKGGGNPSSASERLKNGDALAAQGKHDEAYVEYETSIRLKPSADAHVGIGNIAQKAGQKDRAKAEYHAALEVDPSSAPAYRQLGLMKYSQGDVVGANAALSRSLVLNPKDDAAGKSLVELWQHQVSKVPSANSHLGLARAYQLSGNLQAAQTEYKNVVRLDPENAHLPAARQAFKLALSRHDATVASEGAHTLEAHGAISDAYEKAHEAVRLSPGDADFRVYQGQLLEKLNKHSAARDAYLNALKINPQHAIAASRLQSLPANSSPPLAPELGQPLSQTLMAPSVATAGSLTEAVPSGVTSDPVVNISNFATSLRDHMFTQKNQIQQFETAAQSVLSQIGKPTTETLATSSDAAIDAALAAEPVAAPANGSVSDALSSAAAAIAAANGGAPATTTAATASSAAESTFLKPGSKASSAYNQMQSLRKQNDQLQSQLKKMNESLQKIKGASPDISSAPSVATSQNAVAMGSPLAAEAAFEPPVAPSISSTLAAAQQLPGGQLPGINYRTPVIDPGSGKAIPLRQPISVPNAVRLELEGASPRMGSVELSVILRNDGDAPLPIPSRLKAIINYSNRRPAEVKPVFADAAVPAHGAIRGIIRVPFDKVDPSADLVIPGLLPEGYSQRDVHLITSMASR